MGGKEKKGYLKVPYLPTFPAPSIFVIFNTLLMQFLSSVVTGTKTALASEIATSNLTFQMS